MVEGRQQSNEGIQLCQKVKKSAMVSFSLTHFKDDIEPIADIIGTKTAHMDQPILIHEELKARRGAATGGVRLVCCPGAATAQKIIVRKTC